MSLVVLLLLALIFGGVGLVIEGMRLLLIFAVVLILASVLTGYRDRL